MKARQHIVSAHSINARLNGRQRLFVAEYLRDRNATRAYQRAGYRACGHVAEVNASRLLRHAVVAAAIKAADDEAIARVQDETGIDLATTLRELGRTAFFDPRKFFDERGCVKSIADLDDDSAAALASFEQLDEFVGNGDRRVQIGFMKKVKLADKLRSLDMLMKHLGGYKEDHEQAGKATGGALAALLGQMRGSALPVVKDAASDA